MKKIIRLTENDLTRLVKKIIKEDMSLFIKRRMENIDDYINDSLTETDPEEYSLDEYADEIVWKVVDMCGLDLTPKELDELMEYILKTYWDDIESYYDGVMEFDDDDITESVDTFYRRRIKIFEEFLDIAISETTPNEFDAEDYKDYRGEIEWRTLTMYEDENGEVDDVEGFFELSKHFTNKIRKGYAKYMKS
jgi:hypothetical protein